MKFQDQTRTGGTATATQKGEKPGRLVYAVAWSYTTLSMLTGFFLPVFFRDELGFGGVEIGFLFAMQSVTIMIASAPSGLGNDWITSRFLIVAGLAAQALGLALMGTVTGFGSYVPVFFLWSLGGGLFKVSLDVQLLKTASGDHRIKGVYLYQLSRYVGGALGSLGSGFLLSQLEFSTAMIWVAVAYLLLAGLALQLPSTKVTPSKLSLYKGELRRPKVILMGIWLVLFATHWGAEMTSYGLYLQQDRGLGWVGMGAYIAAEMSAIIIMLAWLLRRPNQEPNIRALATWGLVFSALGQICMVFGPLWMSVLFRMLHGAGDGAIFLVFYLGVPRLFALERLGGHAGIVHFMSMAGAILGSLVYGPMGERFGYDVPMWVSGLVTALLAVVIVIQRLARPKP